MFDLAGLTAAVRSYGRVARVVVAAHDGSSPREVGAAAGSGDHDPQVVKRVWHLLARFGRLA